MVKLVVHKVDLQWLQKNGYVGQEQVAILWEQLTQKCPNLPSEGENNEQQTTVQLDLPPVIGTYLGEHPRTDICIAYSLKNGEKLASRIIDGISKQSAKTSVLAYRPDAPFNPEEVEKNVATSGCLVVLLTQDCLKQVEVVYSMLVAKFYYQHPSLVILVHDAESCFFPGYDEQPPSVKDFFSEKAITFLGCMSGYYFVVNDFQGYPEEGIEEILAKFDTEMHVLDNILKNFRQRPADALLQFITKNEHRKEFPIKEIAQRMKDFMTPEQLKEFIEAADTNKDGTIDQMELPELISVLRQKTSAEKPAEEQVAEVEEEEDITTRVFLSHKRSTGQGIAGRFYEGLKVDYRVFIDSEAKFKIHNLKSIVQNTDAFVFLLTYGIMLSKWCLEELKSAIANGRRIIVVRELSYTLPDVLPPEWQEVESVIRTSPELVWLAEYNSACVKALKKFIGSPDDHWKPTLKSEQNPEIKAVIQQIIEKARTTGTFDFNADIAVPESDEIFADAVLDLVLRQVPAQNIKNLKIKPFKTTNSDVIKYLILQLAHLDNVDVNSDIHVDNSVVKSISHRLNGLARLRVQNASITDEAIRFLVKHNPRLIDLEIVECKSVTQAGLDLAVQLPRLQRLTVVDSILKKGEPASKLVSTNLQYLQLAGLAIGDAALEVFQGLPTLQELSISTLENVTPAELDKFLRSLPNLKSLHLSRSSNVNDLVVRAITEQHSKLLGLDLSYDASLNEAALVSILSTCHSVQDLNFAGLAVDDNTLKLIAEGCPDLQKLNIRLSFNVSTLEPLAALKGLKEVHISSSKALENDKFAENHKEIKVVESTDAYDISQGWSGFSPAVVVARKAGQVLLHLYGLGEETWVTEGTEALVPFHTRADQYGRMEVEHTNKGCKTCAALHSQCRGDSFSGTLNMFFIDEDFEKWHEGTSATNEIVNTVKSRGEFIFTYNVQRLPVKLQTVVNYVIKQVGDATIIKTVRLSELKELELLKLFPSLEGVTLTGYFPDYENWADRLREALPNIKNIAFVETAGSHSSLVFEKFPDLETLRLDARFDDKDLEKLPSLTKLRSLNISGLEQLTENSIKKIGQLTQLTTLIASGVSAIKDDTFALLYPLVNLEVLSVSQTGLTEKGFVEFKNHFPKLTKFYANIKFLYDEAVCKSVSENHPALAEEWKPRSGGDLSLIVDVLDTVNKWYPASIIEQNEKQIKIHYYGWNTQYNEWLDRTSPRVAPPLSHSHEYGKQGTSHPKENCEHCPNLHPFCKEIKFGGGPNVYFQ